MSDEIHDEENLEALSGIMTAQKFLIQNIYALILAQQADPLNSCSKMASDLRMMFKTLPADENAGNKEEERRIREHGLEFLDEFWGAVHARLQAHVSRKRRH